MTSYRATRNKCRANVANAFDDDSDGGEDDDDDDDDNSDGVVDDHVI